MPLSKSGVRKHRGFESHPLRHLRGSWGRRSVLSISAERSHRGLVRGTGNAVWGNPSRVRIPPSPPPHRPEHSRPPVQPGPPAQPGSVRSVHLPPGGGAPWSAHASDLRRRGPSSIPLVRLTHRLPGDTSRTGIRRTVGSFLAPTCVDQTVVMRGVHDPSVVVARKPWIAAHSARLMRPTHQIAARGQFRPTQRPGLPVRRTSHALGA